MAKSSDRKYKKKFTFDDLELMLLSAHTLEYPGIQNLSSQSRQKLLRKPVRQ